MSTIVTLAAAVKANASGFEAGMQTARSAARAFGQEQREVARIVEETRTPLERYESEVAKLSELESKGKISFDTWTRGIAKAKQELKEAGEEATTAREHFTLMFETIGAYEIGSRVYESAKGVFEGIGQQARTAEAIGATATQLGQLQYAADVSLVSVDSLTAGLGRMLKNIGGVATGQTTSLEVTRAIEDLHLQIRDLAGESPTEQFESIAEALNKIENPARRAADAQALFGRGWIQLMPLLKEGKDGLRDLFAEAD